MGDRGSIKSMEIKIMGSKKAQLFTILAIALVILMLLSLEVYSSLREKQAVKKRVETMDSFLHAIEGNLENQAYIAGYRIILLAEEDISKNGIYVNDIQDFFPYFLKKLARWFADILHF